MAQLFSTGPANLYVSIYAPSSSNPTMSYLLNYPAKANTYFLGTCEKPPNIAIEPSYLPIKADIGGPDLAFDHLFTGETGAVSGILNRWNEAVYEKITARPILNATRGSYGYRDVGRPMMLSGLGSAFCLWVQFPYAVKKSTFHGSMPKAYRFPGAVLFGPDLIVPGTSRRQLTFWCGRVYKRADGTWKVYDHLVVDPGDATNALPLTPPISASGAIS